MLRATSEMLLDENIPGTHKQRAIGRWSVFGKGAAASFLQLHPSPTTGIRPLAFYSCASSCVTLLKL